MQYTHWHLQHCKSQLSKGDIQADQQQHTFPPHIRYIQTRKALSSDREHIGCTEQSQNSTTFLQDTSSTAAQSRTFPPHIECIQMMKAPSSDREHTGCSEQSQNSTTFLLDTSSTAAPRETNTQRDTWYNHSRHPH